MNILSYRTSFRAWWLNEAADFDGNANHIVLYRIKKQLNVEKADLQKVRRDFYFHNAQEKAGKPYRGKLRGKLFVM